MICRLLTNINFWSAVFGLIGSVLLFFFGLPPKVDIEGHQHLTLEGIDEKEKRKASCFIKLGNLGMLLIIISFLLQIVQIIIDE